MVVHKIKTRGNKFMRENYNTGMISMIILCESFISVLKDREKILAFNSRSSFPCFELKSLAMLLRLTVCVSHLSDIVALRYLSYMKI